MYTFQRLGLGLNQDEPYLNKILKEEMGPNPDLTLGPRAPGPKKFKVLAQTHPQSEPKYAHR